VNESSSTVLSLYGTNVQEFTKQVKLSIGFERGYSSSVFDCKTVQF